MFGSRLFCFVAACSISCIEYNHKPIPPHDDIRPAIKIEPEFIDFGAVAENERKTEVLTLSNIGDAVLDISNIHLSEGAFSFTMPNADYDLEPGEEVELLVSYQPINISDTRKMRISSNDRSQPEVDVPLVGMAAYPALRISPNPYSFAWTDIGTTLEGHVTFESIGAVDLTVENALVLGESFGMGDVTFPFTIPAGSSISFPVTFSPDREDDFDGNLWVQSNAPGPDAKIDLLGYTGAGNLLGRICNPSGDGWIIGAEVHISIDFDGDGIEDLRLQDVTDEEGRYNIEGVPKGLWTVHVQKGSYHTEFEVDFPGGNYELPEDVCLDPSSVQVAVVQGDFDNIGALLHSLQIEYDAYGRGNYLTLLRDPQKMAEYDIIFFNCGMPMNWLEERGSITSNIKEYVENGGSVYASDWAHAIVEATFPYAIDFHGDDAHINPSEIEYEEHNHAYVGAEGEVLAEVLDPIMAGAIGSTHAGLYYDLGSWVLPSAAGPGSSIMLQGSTYYYTPTGYLDLQNEAPLAIQFSAGGRVIYTSFHNEHQMTQDMEAALKEMILSL